MSSLFHTMFPDSKIAKDMTIGTDKIRYVIKFGIALIFKSMLVQSLRLSECYVVSSKNYKGAATSFQISQ